MSVCTILFIATITVSWSNIPITAMNILAIEPVTGRSHWNFMSALLRALTDNGHRITAFTPLPDGERINYTEIDISNEISAMDVGIDSHFVMENFRKSTVMIPLVMNWTRCICSIIYEHPKMKNIILNNKQFDYDLIIVERAASECVTYIAAKLDIPIIFSSPSPLKTTIEYSIIGNGPNPASVSHIMAYHSVPKTFFQRLTNSLLYAYSSFLSIQKETEMKINNPGEHDLMEPVKPSIVFLNTHYITEAPRPFPPNVIQVGGIHLQSPKKDIPTDILEYIDNSPHGVIYFTFGSIVEMSTLPDHIQNACKDGLSKVPQRILWKYEGEMKNKPINVMTRKWFPQREILLHPKVKLFISHGGISGVYEAIDASVPVLGLPVFYDQPRNIENLVDAGMAISIDLLSVTKENIFNAANKLINNKKYRKNANLVSNRFKDRPMTPARSVVYWTEYVCRHKSTPHLKSYAFNLTWYQYYLLDVIAVMLLLIISTVYITYKKLI
ncbi:UDP-glucuronosyltransferase 2B15-like [Rhopalosiphum maidis]|uniref:UDP-glucuronosyltransferase 2B15-like n=1 Tax=Rhopalosiphum maidis TaxID=43146 RepID=UPI000F00E69D|nr:UDP-glucuronosyltransferase 2B15-like [Rhopalosiphum maidis]